MSFQIRSLRMITLALGFGFIALSGCGTLDHSASADPNQSVAVTATAAGDFTYAPVVIGSYPGPSAAPTASLTPVSASPTAAPTASRTPSPIASATSAPTASPTPLPTAISGNIWRPAPGTTWQWQLTDLPIDQSFNVTMYDIDLFDNEASVVAALHAQGRKVICYISAGTWEDWRPDAATFPAAVKGDALDNWPGERWLDIRNLTVLGPIMAARMDLCKAKGFDGIEPDNVDGYTNDTGFPITAQHQLAYNRLLASMAHQRGLSVGLKNDLDQVADLEPLFDWAMNEQCFQYEECDPLGRFIQAGKAVFQVEYDLETDEFCPEARSLRFSSMLKRLDLDAYRVPCS